MSEQLLQDNES